jgi:5-formyltetrahydrofolate cyclo-ligase
VTEEIDGQMNKSALRKQLLQARRSLAVTDWQAKSQRICDYLQQSTQFRQAQTVLAYFSFRQEPNLSPLFTPEKTWGFPRCVNHSLVWHCWSPQSPLPLQAGAYGIPEPDSDLPTLTPKQVDLILVPAVACDRRGYRLGYGGGFYDRLFSHPDWATKPAIGIIFDLAYHPHLPNDPWDKPLTAVCTESGIFPTIVNE